MNTGILDIVKTYTLETAVTSYVSIAYTIRKLEMFVVVFMTQKTLKSSTWLLKKCPKNVFECLNYSL